MRNVNVVLLAAWGASIVLIVATLTAGHPVNDDYWALGPVFDVSPDEAPDLVGAGDRHGGLGILDREDLVCRLRHAQQAAGCAARACRRGARDRDLRDGGWPHGAHSAGKSPDGARARDDGIDVHLLDRAGEHLSDEPADRARARDSAQ